MSAEPDVSVGMPRKRHVVVFLFLPNDVASHCASASRERMIDPAEEDFELAASDALLSLYFLPITFRRET